MEIKTSALSKDGAIKQVKLYGRLDAAARQTVRDQLHHLLNGQTQVIVLDMAPVFFMDSSGLSALVSGLRVAREKDKDILLVGLNKQARQVFDLTLMDRVFQIFLDTQAALDTLNP